MKYFLIILFILLYYLSQTKPFFMLLFEQSEAYRRLEKPIIYKKISKIEDISSVYTFSCKEKWLNVYKNYEIGIEFKDKIVPTIWNKDNPAKKGEYYIKANLNLKDQKNNILYSKKIFVENGYGWLNYQQFMFLDRFKVNKCKKIILEIDFIESTIDNIPEDMIYFYIKVDTNI